MTRKEFFKLKQTCENNGIELKRSQYLDRYKYYVNGKLQKSILDMYNTIIEIIGNVEEKNKENKTLKLK